MGRGSQPLLIFAAWWLLAHAGLSAQDPTFPRLGADPVGKVVDERGNPIEGATVVMTWDPEASAPWRGAIAQALAQAPLPSAVSDRDGDYVLPLSREQRRLGVLCEGVFSLVIQKDGYVPWNEPLPNGPWGFLGSRATLRTLAPFERIRLEVVDPQPGMLVVVRLARGPATLPAHAKEVRSATVPADGKVEIPIPWVRSPWTVDGIGQPVIPLRSEACVIHPGRTTPPLPIDPEAVTRLGRSDTPNARTLKVRRSDGKPVQALRGLYRTEAGEEFWFEGSGASLALDERLALVKVKAEGCAELYVETGAEEATIEVSDERAPARDPVESVWPTVVQAQMQLTKLRVRVVDENSRPLEGASVRISDDAKHAPCWQGPVRTTDAQGVVRLDEVPCHSFRVLAVDEEHLPVELSIVPKAGAEEEVTLVLGPQTVHRILATTPSGRPAAFVAMMDRARLERAGARSARSTKVVTDSQGRALARRNPEDGLQLQVGSNVPSQPETTEDGTIRVACPEAPPVLLRIPFGAQITEQERQYQGGASSGALDTKAKPFALLLGGSRPDRELVIYSTRGKVPFLFEGSDVTPATPRLGGVAVLDLRTPARRIPIDPTSLPEQVLAELEIAPTSPHHGGTMVGKRHGNLLQRGADGKPEIALTTLAALSCNVMHPDYLRQKLTIEPRGVGQGAETPIQVQLEPAARVEVRLRAMSDLAKSWPVIAVRKLPQKESVWFSNTKLEGDAAGEVRFCVPFGLAPGEYELTISGLGEPVERTFTIEGKTAVVVELGEVAAKKGG